MASHGTLPAPQAVDPPPWHRPLLPDELRDRPSGRRSARDWLVDVALFALAVLGGFVLLDATLAEHSDAGEFLDLLAGSVACLALWLRRSRPLAVALVAVPLSAVSAMAGIAAAIALFSVALRSSRSALAFVAALSLASTAVFPLLYPQDDAYLTELAFGVLITGVVVGWGLFMRARRQLVFSLRERAERLEDERRLHVEQAREAERRRIAGEMHDVLAHRLSLLSLHAGALEFRPDAAPAQIAEAAGVIRANARAALDELRDVIGVLREHAPAAEHLPEPPQPTLAQLPALVEESRAAGMRVRCAIDLPDADALPSALGRTAYRVVQEGLTNARKHAPAAAVEVTVRPERGERLVVEVRSRPPVGASSGGEDPLPGAGTGLIGLSERVALAGGALDHGPDAQGDFVLHATLPLADGR